MPVGTPLVIGFYPTTQRPVDERYLNNGVAYADTDEVLAAIAVGSRHIGLTVNVAGVEYWFTDTSTLEEKTATNDQTATEVLISDAGNIFDSENVEDALQEVKSIADTSATALESLTRTVYEVSLPAGDLATKIAGATFSPSGWATIAIDSTTNAKITHALTGRKPISVKVWEIDSGVERLTKDYEDAFSGFICDSTTATIEGINPTNLALRVSFIFN